MEKFTLLSGLIVLGSFLLSACGLSVLNGSGKIVSENRPVKDFDQISFSGMGDMYLQQGDEESLRIEAEDNLLPYIKSDVVNGSLRIYFDHNNLHFVHPTQPVRIYVGLKQVKSIELSGAVRMLSESLRGDTLHVDISGSGNMDLKQLEVNELTTKISGSGKCNIQGETNTQNIVISGSGKFDTRNLYSRDVNIRVSGSGKAQVNAEEQLDVHISGSGDVAYFGNPRVQKSISGSGNVYQQSN